ncbi:MAG: hypothetical protein Q9182_003292 [Xanthomendoza sp. 2 TL-2023]
MPSFALPYAHLEQIINFLVLQDKNVEPTRGQNSLARAPPLTKTITRSPKSKKRRPVASDWFTPESTPDPQPLETAQTLYTTEDIERLLEEESAAVLEMKAGQSKPTLPSVPNQQDRLSADNLPSPAVTADPPTRNEARRVHRSTRSAKRSRRSTSGLLRAAASAQHRYPPYTWDVSAQRHTVISSTPGLYADLS